MKKRKLGFALALVCLISLLTGCTNNAETNTGSTTGKKDNNEHEAITMISAFPGTGVFTELVKEKYPEINLEIIPYSGNNMTAYVKDQLKTGIMPDIYVSTVYAPIKDVSDRLIDLSGYSFTNNYAESQLRGVSSDGALYMLPTYFSCLGITYNKTLLEKNGWTLPTTFAELEELAPKVREAGYELAINQLSLPGYGFQYFCNILDTDYLNTLGGRKWQSDFLNDKTTMKDSPEMMSSLSTLEKWRELGMLTADTDENSSLGNTKAIMAEGHTLFMLGATNNFTKEDSDDEFGIMPYLSQDGTQNALVLNVSRYVGLNKHLEDEGNAQKLEDAVHVLEVMSTVEGMSAISYGFENTMLLPLQDYVIPETNFYKQVESEINAGLTAPFIYEGWDNLIVPTGEVVIEYIKGNATLEDVAAAFDDNQNLLTDNSSASFTKVTETLDMEDCAKLVGIAFGKASGADLALISMNKWYPEANTYVALNVNGVSGSLLPMDISDQEITAILPTGWRGNIETFTFTGKRIKELMETGYERKERFFPYMLVSPEGFTLEDDATYTVAMCGVTDEAAQEGNRTDTGILGLDAMKEYLSRFETLSKDDIRWE